MSNPLLVGVDVHRKSNTVCLMDRQGREIAPRFTVDNNRPGTETFRTSPAKWSLVTSTPSSSPPKPPVGTGGTSSKPSTVTPS